MAKGKFVKINGVQYRKSTYSYEGGHNCVGVACINSEVLVTNTNNPVSVVRFTKEEWLAFLAGVKDNQFDIGRVAQV